MPEIGSSLVDDKRAEGSSEGQKHPSKKMIKGQKEAKKGRNTLPKRPSENSDNIQCTCMVILSTHVYPTYNISCTVILIRHVHTVYLVSPSTS